METKKSVMMTTMMFMMMIMVCLLLLLWLLLLMMLAWNDSDAHTVTNVLVTTMVIMVSLAS